MASKKEVRLIFNLDDEKESNIYKSVSGKTVATAFIKDLLYDYFNGSLVNKIEYDNILNHISNAINFNFEDKEENIVEVCISLDEEIEEFNEFED